jgi:hypothetical protein
MKTEELGVKHDTGKIRLDLVPPELMIAVGTILSFGADKYGDNNWRGGLNYSRIVGALLRHLVAYQMGEKIDPESGKPHLWHAACNLAFLITFESHPDDYKKFDDLYTYGEVSEKEDKETI